MTNTTTLTQEQQQRASELWTTLHSTVAELAQIGRLRLAEFPHDLALGIAMDREEVLARPLPSGDVILSEKVFVEMTKALGRDDSLGAKLTEQEEQKLATLWGDLCLIADEIENMGVKSASQFLSYDACDEVFSMSHFAAFDLLPDLIMKGGPDDIGQEEAEARDWEEFEREQAESQARAAAMIGPHVRIVRVGTRSADDGSNETT